MAPILDPSADYTADGTGAEERPAAEKIGDTVSVLDYIAATEHADMKAGTSTYDASADFQAAIDANKGGTIVHPAGYTIEAAGMTLSGSTYNGTGIVVEGTLLMRASGGGANGPGGNGWSAFIFHDVDRFLFDCPGLIDGNRGAQAANQWHFCLSLFGARNGMIPRLRCREIRGDALFVTNKNHSSTSTNSADLSIGQIEVWNSADDGRQAVSICSGERIVVGSILSTKVGGVINSVRMPGGFDIEPDGNWHAVRDIRVGRILVATAGAFGVAVLGQSLSGNDANEDWNVENVEIDNFTVISSSDSGPIFRRVRNLKIAGSVEQTTRGGGLFLDYLNGVSADLRARKVQAGVCLGFEGWVRDFDISARVADYSGPAVLTIGVNKGRLRASARGSTGVAGTFMLQIADAGRTLTQDYVLYDVDFPADSVSAGILYGSTGGGSITVGTGTCVTGSMAGMSTAVQFLSGGAVVPTRNIEGRNFATAVPGSGIWLRGEEIVNTAPSAGGTPGWVCTTSGTAGSTAVFKARANVAA